METALDKNPCNNTGRTPLHSAAQYGHLEICQLICENIVDLDPHTINGLTPISLANANGHLEIVACIEWARAWQTFHIAPISLEK